MSYAAQLIDAVKEAMEITSDRALAVALGVKHPNISQWRHGVGSPMPPERVMQLCEMAHVADPGPWLIGVQADAVRVTGIRHALESVLDRARPTISTAAIVGAVTLAVFFHNEAASTAGTMLAYAAALPVDVGIMRNQRRW